MRIPLRPRPADGHAAPSEDPPSSDNHKMIKYDKQAQKDAKNLKAAKLDTKAKEIIETLKENPLKNPPPYEELVGNLAGLYSRRINLKHRIVYEIIEKTITEKDIEYEGIVKVIRMWTHYDKVK